MHVLTHTVETVPGMRWVNKGEVTYPTVYGPFPPTPHTHTKKNTTTTTLPKNHLFFVGGGQFASHELSCYLLLQEWLEKNAEEVKQVARAAYNRIPDKSLGLHRKGNGDPFPLFQ